MQLKLLLRNIPFELERIICSSANRKIGRRPSSAPFVSGDTFRAMADFLFDETTSCRAEDILDGAVVFVSARRIDEFFASVLPQIRGGIILITHQGDVNIDDKYRKTANNPRIIHWFAQNCLIRHEKVSPLPIGLEDRWRHDNGEYGDFKRINRISKPVRPRIAYAFNLCTNIDKRVACYRELVKCRIADGLIQPLNSSLYRESARQYCFIASPPGNGVDCHRTWEAMYMHCVPIVERNTMHEFFRSMGLPLLLIDNWAEIHGWDEARLQKMYTDIMDNSNTDALWAEFWKKKLIEARG